MTRRLAFFRVVLFLPIASAAVACARDSSPTAERAFEVATRGNSFANATLSGIVALEPPNVLIRVSSLRVSVMSKNVWNDLDIRAQLIRRNDRTPLDSSAFVRLPTDSTFSLRDQHLEGVPSFRLTVPGSARPEDFDLAFEIVGTGPIPGMRLSNYARFDSLFWRSLPNVTKP